ncbi:hypothetical protein INR49_004652, partial [Caranx melampygus]
VCAVQKWDPSLKLLAEGYATKCIWNHNPELEDTGENLFAGDGPLDLREALEKWFLEHLDYDYQNNSCDEDKMCGHYTQLLTLWMRKMMETGGRLLQQLPIPPFHLKWRTMGRFFFLRHQLMSSLRLWTMI